MLPVIAIIVMFFAAALCFFFKSGNPRGFDNMPESIEPDPTEYYDSIKIVPTGDREPAIRKTISV